MKKTLKNLKKGDKIKVEWRDESLTVGYRLLTVKVLGNDTRKKVLYLKDGFWGNLGKFFAEYDSFCLRHFDLLNN